MRKHNLNEQVNIKRWKKLAGILNEDKIHVTSRRPIKRKKIIREAEEAEETEEKSTFDVDGITNQTTFNEFSTVDDAKAVLKQILTKDGSKPIFKAMEFNDKEDKLQKPNPEAIAAWVEKIGVDKLAQRMVDIGKAIPSQGLAKKDMPFLPGPEDAEGSVDDVEDALTPGGKYNVDFKNEAIKAPTANTFLSIKDKGAEEYMTSGAEDGDEKDDTAKFVKNPSIPASKAKPTQTNILVPKAIGMGSAKGGDKFGKGGPMGAYFSTDNEILDGHHRWAATMMNNPGTDIGGFGAIDLKAMGGKTKALKHLTAIGNALGNKTKTKEGLDPKQYYKEYFGESELKQNVNEIFGWGQKCKALKKRPELGDRVTISKKGSKSMYSDGTPQQKKAIEAYKDQTRYKVVYLGMGAELEGWDGMWGHAELCGDD